MKNYRFCLWLCLTIGLSLACSLVSPVADQSDTASVQVFDSRNVDLSPAKVETYTIVGSSEDELRMQMNELGPIADDGIRYDAVTRWWVNWNWPPDRYGGCDLAKVDVSYTIIVKLPYWSPPPDVLNRLVEKWNGYLEALTKHEKTHVENVTDYVPLVKQAVMDATCDSANAAAYAVLDELKEADRVYDKKTGHGNTQGVRFP